MKYFVLKKPLVLGGKPNCFILLLFFRNSECKCKLLTIGSGFDITDMPFYHLKGCLNLFLLAKLFYIINNIFKFIHYDSQKVYITDHNYKIYKI